MKPGDRVRLRKHTLIVVEHSLGTVERVRPDGSVVVAFDGGPVVVVPVEHLKPAA